MAWRETDINKEKLMFIADWIRNEFYFSDLCKRYEISRKTGYKIINRYNEEGEFGLQEKSRAKHTFYNVVPHNIQARIIQLKYRFPKWGPSKLRDWLMREESYQPWPASSTIGDLLKKHGLVKKRKIGRKVQPHSAPFLQCISPNSVWSADFKGQFRLGNQQYCYPLTISDNFSRFLLLCEGLERPTLQDSIKCFEKAFYEYGLPDAIRTDNGQPFAGTGIAGLTRLSIWWIKLGINPERIAPGHPEQNGRHERMHRTLKEATAKPPQKDMNEQQKTFESFKREYNEERSHEALKKKRPVDIYIKSNKPFPNRLPEIIYPDSFMIRKVRTNGFIRWKGNWYFLSELLHGEPIGLELIDEDRALLHFSKVKLGIVDSRTDKITRV